MLERLLARGLRARRDPKGSLRVETAEGELLLKRIGAENLREQAFVVVGAIPGLVIEREAQTFELDGELYQAIAIDPALRPSSDALACGGITALYTHHSSVAMLGPSLDLEGLVRGYHTHHTTTKSHGHPDAKRHDLGRAADRFLELVRDLVPARPERLRTGFVHEDLQTGNILHAEGALHLIDLDPVLHSYSVLNLSHFLVQEVIAKSQPALLEPLRARFVAALVEESDRDFDFFVMLSVFRALVRRAFHRDYFHAGWEEELSWYLRELGVKGYLERLA